MSSSTKFALLALPLLCGAAPACSRSPSPATGRTSAALSDKAPGNPCTASDGWTPPAEDSSLANAPGPVAVTVPPGTLQRHTLAPGIGYCLDRGPMYPHGYYTMNCKSDGDCPAGSRCDGMLCRRPCSSDSECTAPTRCAPAAGVGPSPVRYCSWFDNPAFKEPL